MRNRLNLRFSAFVAVATVLAAGGWYALHCYQKARLLGNYLAQASRAEQDDKPDRALRLLRAYIAQAPDDTAARVRYAELVDRRAVSIRGRSDALAAYQDVVRLAPDDHKARLRTIELALELGRLGPATEHIAALEKRSPGNGRMLYFKGVSYEARTRFEDAAQAYEASRKADPRPDAAMRLATLYRKKLDQPDKADGVMKELVASRPTDPAAYTARAVYARVYEASDPLNAASGPLDAAAAEAAKARALDAAAAHVAKARALAPDSPEVLLLAADVALDRARREREPKKRDEHIQHAREALAHGIAQHPESAPLHLILADVEALAGRKDEALRVVRAALPKVAPPTRPQVLFAVAERAADVGDAKATGEAVAELRKLKQDPVRVDFAEVRALAIQGRWFDAAGAIERIRPLLGVDPARSLQADLLLAAAYGHMGETDRQVAVYLRAVNAAPLDPRPRLGLAAAYAALGRVPEAAAEYERLTQRKNGAPVAAWLALARIQVYRTLARPAPERQWGPVESLLDTVEQEVPDSPDVPLLRAETKAAQGDAAAARRVLVEARDARPASPEFWYALAVLTDRGGDSSSAAGILDEAERRFGDSVDLRLTRLRVTPYTSEAQALAVLARLSAGTERFPEADRARLLRSVASAYWLVGKPDVAGPLWKEVARLRPTELGVRVLLFDVALRTDDEKGMEEVLDDFRRIEGDGPFGQFGRANLLIWKADRGERSVLPESRRLLQSVAARRPGWSRVPLALAKIDELEGDTARAIEAYDLAVKQGERQPAVIRKLVELLSKRQRYKDADEVIRRLETQAPLSEDLARLGAEQSLQALQPERALELGRRAVKADSDKWRERVWLGQLMAASGKPEAEAEFEAAVGLAPDEPEPLVALTQYHVRRRDATKAEAATRRVEAKAAAGDRWALALARCYELAGRKERAAAAYQAAVAATPLEPRVLRAAAESYLLAGNAGVAEPLLRGLLRPDVQAEAPDTAWARRNLALGLGLKGDDRSFAEAMTLLDHNRSAGESAEDLRTRAVLLATRPDRRKDAIKAFEEAEQSSPSRPDHEFILARLYEAQGDWGKARDRMLRLIGLQQQDTTGFLAGFVGSLVRRGNLSEADVWAGQFLRRYPNAAAAVRLQAQVWLAQGKVVEAGGLVREYAEATVGDPADPAARALAAARLMEQVARAPDGEPFARDAEQYYTRCRDLANRPEAGLPLAAFFGRRNEPDRALAECDRAAAAGVPVEQVAAAAVAAVGGRAGPEHVRRVEDYLTRAAAARPGSADTQFALATLREHQGRYPEAERVYRDILARPPGHLGALNNLAALLALTGRAAEAAPLADRVVAAVSPPPAALLDTRGLVLTAAGRLDEARRDLEAAAADAGASAATQFHLATVYLRLGDRRRAEAAWRQAAARGIRPADLHPLERPGYDAVAGQLGKQ